MAPRGLSAGSDVERLIQLLARLPGLGPRSARRAALALIRRRDTLMAPLGDAIHAVLETITECQECGNVDSQNPCTICTNGERDNQLICVVESVADLWALERAGAIQGHYHVLGGALSAIDGVGPDDLRIPDLVRRAARAREVILALSATVDGQTTAHYIADSLEESNVILSRLAHGVPVGGELDYMDEGTLTTAIRARRPMNGGTGVNAE